MHNGRKNNQLLYPTNLSIQSIILPTLGNIINLTPLPLPSTRRHHTTCSRVEVRRRRTTTTVASTLTATKIARIKKLRMNNRTPPSPLSLPFTLSILIRPNLKLIHHLDQVTHASHAPRRRPNAGATDFSSLSRLKSVFSLGSDATHPALDGAADILDVDVAVVQSHRTRRGGARSVVRIQGHFGLVEGLLVFRRRDVRQVAGEELVQAVLAWPWGRDVLVHGSYATRAGEVGWEVAGCCVGGASGAARALGRVLSEG
jgi:hypothetical protein